MFAFRLWRRVHRPFLFLIFSISSVLFLTNVSVVSTTTGPSFSPPEAFENEGFSSLESENRLRGRMIINDEDSSEEEGGAEMKVELGMEEEIFVPVPDMQQLPFCNTAKSRGQSNQGQNPAKATKSATTSSATDGLWGTKDNETETSEAKPDEDEDVLVNPNGLSAGKHILVATLDGQLTLLDYTGKLVWSLCTGHLFSSTISTLQLNDRGKYIKLIPSLTGALYSYDGESLQAMPLNAESLLRKSFKLSQDTVITGGKELRTFGIDVDSGNVKYECGMDGCKSPTTATADLTSKEDTSGVVLVIKKQLQTVRAIDSATGTERWNFSVGTHELGLAGVTEGCYEPSEEDHPGNEEPMPLFRMVIPEGVVFGSDPENKILWRHKFESPITQAWTLENNRLKIVDPIKTSPLLDDSPSLYVGIHKQQLYVQESLRTLKKLQGLYELEETGNTSNSEQLQIGWKPSNNLAVIEPQPELAIVPQGNTALAPLHVAPFFVYDRDQIKRPAIEAPPNSSDSGSICLDGDDEDEDVEEVHGNHGGGVDSEVLLSFATLWFWWKEVLGISLVTAVILNILLMRPMAHFVRRRAIEDVLRQVNAFLRRRNETILALPAPSPSSTDSLEVPYSVRARTVSTSSSQSVIEDQTLTFISQYLNEFEPIECLGRGAFGTVFEARKKIDEQSYAVKRIPLPNREKSRVRVMREVKALAKLDHKNIVRYFNAWIESPPQGWLEKYDPLWNSRVLTSASTTFDNSGVGSGDYTSIPSFVAHRKKDYSEIFVHDKTPEESDSFIVFETGSAPASDSGVNFHSKMWNKNQRPSLIEEIEDDEEEERTNGSDRSSSIIPEPEEVVNSKFFRRPTTLDIPSSTDTSENNNCVAVPCHGMTADGKETSPPSIMYLYIQQELCQKRTLQDWLRTSRTRKLRQILLMFSQIVEAVEYIHSNNLIHRDLKPSNIFLAGRNCGDKEEIYDMTVKIGDFGLATTLVANDSMDEFSEGFDTEQQQPLNAKLTGQVGTHLYMSPEQKLHNKAYDHKVDIYSLGLIFFELLVPLCTDMERHNELTRVRKLDFPKSFVYSYSDQHDLIRSMLSPDPDQRPDASDIKISLANQIQSAPAFDPMQSRSKSYPSNLTGSETKRHRLPDDDENNKKSPGSRRIYKTHSAM